MAIVSGIFREILRQAEANRYYFDEEEAEMEQKAAAPQKPQIDAAAESPADMASAEWEKPLKSPVVVPLPGTTLFKADAADFVRGIVMAEVLGPPVSRKKGYGPTRR